MSSLGKNLSRRRTGTPQKKALNKCSTSGKVDDFVYIDLDCDFPDVIVIDVPLSENKRLKKDSPRTVINIDDDDDEDDEVAGGVCSNNDDSASSSGCSSKPVNSSKFANDQSYSFLGERNSPVNLSKQRQNNSRKAGSSGRYGLGSESESASNESDCSDCECMDGPPEKLREQWEMASRRRKTAAHTDAVNPDCRQPIRGGKNAGTKSHASEEYSPTHAGKDDRRETAAHTDAVNPDCRQPIRGGKNAGTKSHVSEEYSPTHAGKDDRREYEEKNAGTKSHVSEEYSPTHAGKDDRREYEEKNAVTKSHVSEEQPTSGFRRTLFDKKGSSASFWNSKSNHVLEEKDAHCQESVISEGNHQKPETAHTYSGSFQMEVDGYGSKCDVSEGSTVHATNDVLKDVVGKPCKKDVIIDRQSFKETDEYKRAMEEEWASRQRQLNIQAEEAQRLRRRKRAQSLRIMDVERRQKQRLEEVRETQKRDEANLNMKEDLRTGIRKELTLVEESCNDMASILRKLGLPVSGGLSPSQNEVQAAYKKAVLKFHPDRASRTDIRQQVEAEEKFKLISRMKERFPMA